MKVFIEKDDKSIDIEFEGSVSSLLAKLNINPETVVVVKNNEIVTEDEGLSSGDSVEILSVVSGG